MARITASPLCYFYASYLKQKMGDCRVSAIISQINALRILEMYGTSSKYIRNNIGTRNIILIVFAEARHNQHASQICYILGLIIGTVKMGTTFQ